MAVKRKPKLSVWKFASCDGCQLSLLDCEDELLTIAGAVEIAYFVEASRAMVKGPYDLTLVDGSITTAHDAEVIKQVRRASKYLVAIGTCANSGGIQALRNFKDVNDFINAVYEHPEYIQTLKESTPIAAHVKVDFGLNGCPINKRQLLEVISAFLQGRPPMVRSHSVCLDCKVQGEYLRDGHGHPLPGAGDPCGLRGALSHLSPRLLRLLRPQGDAQHRVSGRLVQPEVGDERAQPGAGLPGLLRQRPRLSPGERSP